MNEIEFDRMQEAAGMGAHCEECIKAIISDNGAGDTIADVYRSIYKYVDCGPWLSIRKHDGTVVHCDKLRDVKTGEIGAILVGSIVEGSDAEVTADWIELDKCETPQAAVELFNRTVEWVNDEACALWDEANGEED